MQNLLRKKWWKYLSVVLLLYALVAGLYIPLSTGVTKITPEVLEIGKETTVTLTAYNASFTHPENVTQVVIKNDTNLICATNVQVLRENELSATFSLPANMLAAHESELYDVVVHNAEDGTFYWASGVTVAGTQANPNGQPVQCKLGFGVTKPERTTFPYREILYESIRNLYFHVPMWFTMVMLLLFSFGSSIAFLNSGNMVYDVYASQAAIVGVLFGFLGIITGMTWATFTWGAPWPDDPKLTGAAVGMLIYLAYLILRGSLEQELTRAKVSAVYNIFAYVLFIVFIFVLPRLTDSLHPGMGGNPAFSNYDLDNTMRPVFYSAAAGFIILGFWIMSLRVRYTLLKQRIDDQII